MSYIKGGLSDIDPATKCLRAANELFGTHIANCSRDNQGQFEAYSKCTDSALDFYNGQKASCRKIFGGSSSGSWNIKPNPLQMVENRFNKRMDSSIVGLPVINKGFAQSPLFNRPQMARLNDNVSLLSNIDISKITPSQAKSILLMVDKTKLTPEQAAIVGLLQGKATGNVAIIPNEVPVEASTKMIYNIGYALAGAVLLYGVTKVLK